MTTRAKSFGPVQLARRVGWHAFQVARGVRLGLVPAPDRGSRWSAELVEEFAARADVVRVEVGSLPDLGAARTALVLAERFGCEVTVDAVMELGRWELLPVTDFYRASPLFDGPAVEFFTDRDVLDQAIIDGRCVTADAAAEHLRVRRSDFDHLVRAGLIVAARQVRSRWQRARQAGNYVPVYRLLDLETLQDNAPMLGIDLGAVRATPRGRVSMLAALPTATNDHNNDTADGDDRDGNDEEVQR